QGYKGMVHQPDPTKAEDMLEGIIAIRKLHTRSLAETGLVSADEMLYPENHRYLSDILSYVAIGARSVENQQHRLTASGLMVPVGMKNPTGGDYSVMLNSIIAAQSEHTFLYRGWEAHSKGNPLTHAILRGYVDKHGRSHPNYHYEDLALLYQMYAEKGLENMAVIVDSNHCNSGKRFAEQPRIINEVLHSCRHNPDIKQFVKGFMIESYIEEGAQKIGDGVYGKSITDPCLGWDASEKLIYSIADQI
ncbi:MAG: 3-deoxy-7-phosphoheptulonate synthase, partial [Oscillospiraceae bacterium]|nr:3-deoxy-7-phosphoheptulonate synthase [Oscillospiraceae bacterium]